jgi:hypothetical protein
LLWKLWAAVGAIVCGILLATFPGGSVSPWAKLVMLGALLLGAATTVVVVILSSGTGWRTGLGARLRVDPVPLQREREMQSDREIVDRLGELIRERQIDWLRSESFIGPWRDDHIASLRRLMDFDTSHSGIFDPELADAVSRFTEATRAFLGIYDASSVPDPIMRDASWRMAGPRVPAWESGVSTESERMRSRTVLREAAAEVCESHDALSLVSRHKFPPD